jgi:hypothetical protein
MHLPNIPQNQRNPYNIWYNYANQNLNQFNRIAIKYNMARLQFPLNINNTKQQ